ncbi:unnamed protein product, partial [Prorocentrum cordatum]
DGTPILERIEHRVSFHDNRDRALSFPELARDQLAHYAVLHVTLVKASSDPYVVVLVEDNELERTPAVKCSLEPEWNCTKEVPIHTANDVVQLRVMDEDLLTSDDLLGFVEFPVSGLPINEPVRGWLSLTAKDCPPDRGSRLEAEGSDEEPEEEMRATGDSRQVVLSLPASGSSEGAATGSGTEGVATEHDLISISGYRVCRILSGECKTVDGKAIRPRIRKVELFRAGLDPKSGRPQRSSSVDSVQLFATVFRPGPGAACTFEGALGHSCGRIRSPPGTLDNAALRGPARGASASALRFKALAEGSRERFEGRGLRAVPDAVAPPRFIGNCAPGKCFATGAATFSAGEDDGASFLASSMPATTATILG